MGKFDSDRGSSSGGGSKFKSGASGIKKHTGTGKRHASEAPTGKFGFARLKNDDVGDVEAGARDRVSGGGQNRGLASIGSSKKNKNRGGGGQAQASAASSVRSALKHVAVENLVAGGAKKSKLLQKVYDSDAFTGTPPARTLPRRPPSAASMLELSLPYFSTLQASHLWMQLNDFSCSGYQLPACAIVLPVALLPPRQTYSSAFSQQCYRCTTPAPLGRSLAPLSPLFHLPGNYPHKISLFVARSLSGASVAEAVVSFLDDAVLKQHAPPPGSCSPIVVVLCMTSECVNAVAASLRSSAPRALVGKMYVVECCPPSFARFALHLGQALCMIKYDG
jgi:hypothetical protein